MSIELTLFAVVITAKSHNPSILNPDFLAVQKIVPSDWKWTVLNTITTPPISLVQYSNGVAINVEMEKVQVADPVPSGNPLDSKVSAIALSYSEVLPHIPYTGVGINFSAIIEVKNGPEAFLISRFLKDGPWNSPENSLRSLGVRLTYELDDCRLSLSLDPGEVEKKTEVATEKRLIIFAKGNFHHDIHADDRVKDIKKALGHVKSDWTIFQDAIKKAVEVEEHRK